MARRRGHVTFLHVDETFIFFMIKFRLHIKLVLLRLSHSEASITASALGQCILFSFVLFLFHFEIVHHFVSLGRLIVGAHDLLEALASGNLLLAVLTAPAYITSRRLKFELLAGRVFCA